MRAEVEDDDHGTLGYEEFLKTRTCEAVTRDPTDEILKAFRLLEDCETGKISLDVSFEDSKHVAKKLGENMDEKGFKEMTGDIDPKPKDVEGDVGDQRNGTSDALSLQRSSGAMQDYAEIYLC